jgi:hypothetical protein
MSAGPKRSYFPLDPGLAHESGFPLRPYRQDEDDVDVDVGNIAV